MYDSISFFSGSSLLSSTERFGKNALLAPGRHACDSAFVYGGVLGSRRWRRCLRLGSSTVSICRERPSSLYRARRSLCENGRAKFAGWSCQAESPSAEDRHQPTGEPDTEPDSASTMVKVRFINTPSGLDLETAARPGSIILAVADELGLRIPRGCTSGVCGACTCDMVHPALPGGRQTVRVCSTRVSTFPGIDDIVIDVYRMKESATREALQGAAPTGMSRFENIDFDYKAGAAPQVILSPTSPFTRQRTVRCEKCKGTGKHICEACQGSGLSSPDLMCYICVGLRRTRCAECQGTGSRTLRR
ncbi:hypothetical protein F1559_002804 [Cyanidiococcus yangmingshanensis]|uniref:2Fe-2S ferredoxin-type domain-containing protein n=1 Tax=Cyanidiococcus yangmingshanensis TaxID=2690220 RepID=A0A7J7IJ84_9RHOD|nr:hypothetical protein F1559_002804 [Cyanidiococcus yangmingshanensis]